MDPVMPISVEMDAIRFHPAQPSGFLLHPLVQGHERNIGIPALLRHSELGGMDLIVSVPETVREWHHLLIDRGEAQHENLHLSSHFGKQLPESEGEGVNVQLGASIESTDSSSVIQADAQKEPLGALAPQLTAAAPFGSPTRCDPLQPITTDPKRVDHRGDWEVHPFQTKPLAPATAFTIAPTVNTAVSQNNKLFWGIACSAHNAMALLFQQLWSRSLRFSPRRVSRAEPPTSHSTSHQ